MFNFLYNKRKSEKLIAIAVHAENDSIILSINIPINIPIPVPKIILFAK